MSISSQHPQDIRTFELQFLVVILALGMAAIFLTLWIGVGQAIPTIPGASVWETFLWRLPKINVLAIPITVSLVVFFLAQVINSWHFQQWTRTRGVTAGEIIFALLGVWFGSTLALAPESTEYTRQAMTWYGSSLGTILFILLAVLTRNLR
jgi:hypothetical protein